MKKRIGFLMGAILAISLAACSGGAGGGPGPIPTTVPTVLPTATPTSAPTSIPFVAHLAWSGIMAKQGSVTSSDYRAAVTAPTNTVLSVSGDSTVNGDIGDNGSWNAVVVAQVDPAPSTSPAVTFTTNSDVAQVVATPSPVGSTSPGPPAVYYGPASPNTSESSKTVSAVFGSPINQTVSLGTITYKSLVMSCIVQYNSHEHIAGVKWVSGDWVDEPDPTQADFYITYNDPRCGIGYNTPGLNATFNYPGGGKSFSDSTTLDTFTTSDWVNDTTFLTASQIGTINVDGTMPYKVIVFKTRDGSHYVKVWWLALTGGGWAFTYEVSGQGLDSF